MDVFVSISVLISSYILLSSYYKDIYRRSWILTFVTSIFCSVGGLYSNISYMLSEAKSIHHYEYTHELYMLPSFITFFMTYLVLDLMIGFVCYRSQLSILTGYIHHIGYFIVCSCSHLSGLYLIASMMLLLEIPTFVLSLSKFYKISSLRYLFFYTFLKIRVIWALWFCITVLCQYNVLWVTITGILTMVLNTLWFTKLCKSNIDLYKHVLDNHIVYNVTWEDCRIDVENLKITSEDNILTISSAGDNVLDYLIENPNQIVVADINIRQLYLLELKLVCIKYLLYDEFFEIFSNSNYPLFESKFNEILKYKLSDAAKDYWMGHLYYGKNWMYCGSSGILAYTLIHYLLPLFGFSKYFNKIREHASYNEIFNEYKKIYVNLGCNIWNIFFITAFSILSMVPTNQLKLIKDFVKYTKHVLDNIAKSDIVKDNYFLYGYICGKYTKDNCPRYLKEENYTILQNNIHKISYYNELLTDVIQKYPKDHFTILSLLDHMDWLDDNQLYNCWNIYSKCISSSCKIFWRTAADGISNPILLNLNYKRILPDIDRVPMYIGTFIGNLKSGMILNARDPYTLHRNLLSDIKTFLSMTLYPLITTKKNHQEDLYNFYKTQSKYYDNYRNRMLHGRQKLMTTIPFKKQSVYIDIGGGTGCNLEYIKSIIELFDVVYIIDICEPLLIIAQEKLKKLNLDHKVKLILADINTLDIKTLPKADVVTFCYSLTMIPNWKQSLHVCNDLLKENGTIGITDFTVIPEMNCVNKYFWQKTFKQDGVNLTYDHITYASNIFKRQYLDVEYGDFPLLPSCLFSCPYYMFIGNKM
jgi:ubiquinone/menaquinone biosynthesis C-methylase UbiE